MSTSPVTNGRIARRLMATGTVQAVTTVEVGAQVSGVVASLGADYNSLVHEGQIVAKLDAASYDAQLREAVAGRTQAEAALERADADVRDELPVPQRFGARALHLRVFDRRLETQH